LVLLAGVLVAEQARARDNARPSGVTCGGGRWAVKTLSDSAATRVNFTPKLTSVDALRALPGLHTTSRSPRTPPVETTTYRVHALLEEARLEKDHDIHLIIAQPGKPTHTMIVELPDPTCAGVTSSIRRAKIASARGAFIAACGLPPTNPAPFKNLTGTATITGVGFFDLKHTPPQRGVAPNDIELHPILVIKPTACYPE
jgi:hypothetical protein